MLSSISRLTLRIGLLSVLLSGPVLAQEAPVLNAADSDPNKMGWMVGSPPPEDKIIRVDDPDAYAFPRLRWTVCHFRQLMPTVNVNRGLGDPVPLPEDLDPAIDDITFTPLGGDTTMTAFGNSREPPQRPRWGGGCVKTPKYAMIWHCFGVPYGTFR